VKPTNEFICSPLAILLPALNCAFDHCVSALLYRGVNPVWGEQGARVLHLHPSLASHAVPARRHKFTLVVDPTTDSLNIVAALKWWREVILPSQRRSSMQS
jgi:hypothetical protein